MILSRLAGLGLILALTLGVAPKPAPTPAPKETLRSFVEAMLAQAPANYAKMRGARKDGDVYRVRYEPLPQFSKSCYECTITNEFAWTGHPENWQLEQRWTAKSWTSAQLQKYIKTQLTPALAGYTLATTGTKDYPDFTWHNGAKGLWVRVTTFNGGFRPAIGQDLTHSVHELKSPTPADITALRNAVTNFLNLGLGPAADNFASLRSEGKKNELGTMDYPLTVAFGSMLRNCTVTDDSVNTLGLDDYSPKWEMNCETIPMVGARADIEPQIKEAMAAALPSGFTVTTGKYLGIDDYRWDNSSTQIAADIDSFAGFSLPEGLVSFSVGIIHFLPSPAST